MQFSVKLRGGAILFMIAITISEVFITGSSGDRLRMFSVLLLQWLFFILLFFLGTAPLRRFEKKLEQLAREPGEADFRVRGENDLYMSRLYQILDGYVLLKTRAESVKTHDKQIELAALQSQINPHFLYNTLESIRGQAVLDGNEEIARMVEALARFFRYSISRRGNVVPLRDELANIRNYMMIQRYRFNNRFSLEILIDEEDKAAFDYTIPRLVIQPIVENAIFHGLEEIEEKGKVTIEIILTDGSMIITISDNGKGMTKRELSELQERMHSSEFSPKDLQEQFKKTGIALPNIHKRIQLLFGKQFGLQIYSTPNLGTDVEMTLPIRYGAYEEGNSKD